MATILYLFLYVSVDGVNVNAGGGLCVRAWLRARARNHITMTPWNIAKVSGDYLFMMGITLLLGVFIYLFSKNRISKMEGLIFLFFYIVSLVYTISF